MIDLVGVAGLEYAALAHGKRGVVADRPAYAHVYLLERVKLGYRAQKRAFEGL